MLLFSLSWHFLTMTPFVFLDRLPCALIFLVMHACLELLQLSSHPLPRACHVFTVFGALLPALPGATAPFAANSPGFYCLNPFIGNRLAGRLSLGVQSLDVKCDTKTKDNVFVR